MGAALARVDEGPDVEHGTEEARDAEDAEGELCHGWDCIPCLTLEISRHRAGRRGDMIGVGVGNATLGQGIIGRRMLVGLVMAPTIRGALVSRLLALE